ncbi:MAG: S49 family peptidase [Steroidobacteraceae bacterium]|jgi:protease-4
MSTPTPTDPTVTPARPGEAASFPSVVLEVLREMREQRQSFERSAELAAKERKAERRWRNLFQAMFFGAPVLLGLLYFLFFLNSTGFRWGPFGNVVGVVRIEGPIGATERASAENIIPILEKAFGNPNVKGVVLHIDSPGGAPVEAERISTAINGLKAKHRKEVVAVINNLGASAAYMVALNADRIIAAKYSFVGSIGAIMAPWQLDKAIAKVDVAQRVYASGKLKAFLNPFTPVSPEVDRKAQQLVDQMGGFFLAEVKARRGQALKSGVDFGTGEVWPGPEAKELGLVDGVATVDDFVATHWGMKTYDYGPSADSSPFLTRSLQDAIAGVVKRLALSGPAIQ